MCRISKILVSNVFFGIARQVHVLSVATLLPVALGFAQTQFNGTYTANFSGANTFDANHSTTKIISATVPLTVVNGVVTGIGPDGIVQPISGTVSFTGVITFTFGSCGDTLGHFGSTATFSGLVTINSSGVATAKGTWFAPGGAPDPGGTSPGATCPNDTGSWTATRTTTTTGVNQFNGTYTGSATSSDSGSTIPLALTVANGLLTGTASGSGGPPVNLSGTVSASGAVTASGLACSGTLTLTFTGQITITSSGGATATGTWSQPVCGNGPTSGPWTATRTTITTGVTQFNGTYTGIVTGEDASEHPLAFTVTNGVVGVLSGTVSETGAITMSVVVDGSCTVTFTGQITITSSGGATATGTYSRTVTMSCGGGSGSWTATRTATTGVVVNSDIPAAFTLLQSYPNPFNPATTIEFSLPRSGYVTLNVYDTFGREIATLVAENLSAGRYAAKWNAANFASGMYYYRIQAGSFVETRKLILLK